MWNKLTKLLLCLAALQILHKQFTTVECKKPVPNSKGKSNAFGAGVAAGGLAGVLGGAALGHILTKSGKPQEIHHHHHVVVETPAPSSSNTVATTISTTTTTRATTTTTRPPPTSPPQRKTIIEKGQVLSNGCYKQTVNEPHQHDSKRYIETEQLVCPPNLPTANTPTFVHLVPVVTIQQPQLVVPAIHMITVPVHIKRPETPNTAANPQTNNTAVVLSPTPQVVVNATAAPLQPKPSIKDQPSNNVPVIPVTPVANNPLPQPAIVHPIHKIDIPVSPTVEVTPQVIVLSQKTGFYGDGKKKKKNASSILVVNSFCLLLSSVLLTSFF